MGVQLQPRRPHPLPIERGCQDFDCSLAWPSTLLCKSQFACKLCVMIGYLLLSASTFCNHDFHLPSRYSPLVIQVVLS